MNPSLALSALAAALISALPAQAGLVNRWSFNQAASSAPAGTAIADPVGGATAIVRGAGASFSGTNLSLPGTTTGNQTPAAISAYVDLPNGLISSKTNLTLELWASPSSYQAWQRLFSCGRTVQAGDGLGAPGEITGLAATAPGTTQPSDELTLFLNRNGSTYNQQRFEARLNGTATIDASGLYRTIDTNITTPGSTEYHYVVTFEDGVGAFGSNGGRLTWFRDGVSIASLEVGFHLNQIEDVNNWLGRSLVTSDRQAAALYREVRVYNQVLSPFQIVASRTLGPNPNPPTAQPDTTTLHFGQKVAIPVLANDTDALLAVIDQPPQFGTAVPDAFGRILYTHTTGQPVSDTFTYRAANAAGQTAPVTVTVNFSTGLRIANNALNVPAAPPATSWQIVDTFGSLPFPSPTCMATPPGETLRLFVCQKAGLLRVIPDVTATTPTATTFLDLPTILSSRGEAVSTLVEQGLLGLAFHPNYANNRYFYVFYSVDKDPANSASPLFERVSRFTASASDPNVADPNSELILIEQVDQAENHNGGDLHFGPDGYLYITTGDEGNQNDFYNNSQQIWKDFFCAILRIDVDKKPGNLEPNAHPNPAVSTPATNAIPRDSGVARYSIPSDNPYVHTSAGGTWNGVFNGTAVTAGNLPYVRSEFWATGFRNPWRMSFDPLTQELWVGDVGGDAREEIDVVTKGKNYGWAYREGAIAGPKSGQAPANFATLYGTEPIYSYSHGTGTFQGNSITGGLVYRGTRFSALVGAYVFGDYSSGNVWTLRRNDPNPPTVERIAGQVGVSAFARDPSNGDVLLANVNQGRIRRLIGNQVTTSYPATLSTTQLFADLGDLSPNPGLLPYSVNLPFWSDYAQKRRWFILPNGQMTWAKDGLWNFPDGQIWVKHFDLPLTHSLPPQASDPLTPAKRIETRILVKNSIGSYGVSYRWNDNGTDATLVADAGEEFDVAITRNGQPYTQRWRIPSRAECVACHTPQAGHALSFTTRQLNRDNTLYGGTGNQLTLLHQAGYFTNDPGSPHVLPHHLRPDETGFTVEARVRSYLAVNCAYCHQPGGSATPAAWDGRPQITLTATGLINGSASNNGGDFANKLIVPGDVQHSVVINRMAMTNGFTRMPPLGSNEVDPTNIALVADWITNTLPTRQTYADWRLTQFASSTSPEGEPEADPDADGSPNSAEYLAQTPPRDGRSFLRPDIVAQGNQVQITFNVPANRSTFIETSFDLTNWSLWDVPGNAGLPLPGGPITLTAPRFTPQQYFRLKLQEN